MNSIYLLKPYFSTIGTEFSNQQIHTLLRKKGAAISLEVLENYFNFTGTQKRFLDDGGQNIALLGAQTIKEVCTANNLALEDVDTIIYCGLSKHYYEPSTAAMIANELSLFNTPSFDISAACAGMALGVQTAHQILNSNPEIQNIALVAIELPYAGIDWDIHSPEDLIYKGAGLTLSASKSALIVSRKPNKTCISLQHYVTYYDSAYTDICQAPVHASFFSDSAKLLRPSIVSIHKLKDKMREAYGGEYHQSMVIPHQPAKQPISTLAKIMELPIEQVVSVHEIYGNAITGAWISAYLTLIDHSEEQIRHNQPVAIFTAAGGFVSINFIGVFHKENEHEK